MRPTIRPTIGPYALFLLALNSEWKTVFKDRFPFWERRQTFDVQKLISNRLSRMRRRCMQGKRFQCAGSNAPDPGHMRVKMYI